MESANESLDGSRCTIVLCKERMEEYVCSDWGHEHYCRHEGSVRKINCTSRHKVSFFLPPVEPVFDSHAISPCYANKIGATA